MRKTKEEYNAYRRTLEYRAKQNARKQTPKNRTKLKVYQQTPEFKARTKACRQTPEFKAHIKAYRKTPEYKAKNKIQRQTPEYKAKKRAYYKTPQRLIVHRLRVRLNSALKGVIKSGHTMELVGCSADQLKEYLEARFTDGMSWYNYGEWQIDHIRRCASFDLTKPEKQKICFHYSNLQPLWTKDNLEKH